MIRDWFRKTDYRDKIFKHKLQVVYRTLLVLILLVVAVVILKVQADNRVYSKYEIVREMSKVGTQSSTICNYDGNLLVHSKDGISAYNKSGEQIWNQSYEMQKPIVKNSGEYVVAGDYKRTMLYVMGKKGALSQIETNLPILALDVSELGVVAVLLQDKEVTWLRLYSPKGELVSEIKTTMRNNGYPMAFAVSPDNIKLGVAYVKAQAGKINTSLAFYNFGGVGQNVTDNLVSGYEYEGQLFPFIAYIDEETAIAAGDAKVLVLSGKQKPSVEKEIVLEQDLQGIYCDREGFVLVYRNLESSGQYILQIYNRDGVLELEQKIDFEFADILQSKRNVTIYSEEKVLVLGRNGVEKYNGDLGGSIQTLIPGEKDGEFLAVFPQDIKLIKLR